MYRYLRGFLCITTVNQIIFPTELRPVTETSPNGNITFLGANSESPTIFIRELGHVLEHLFAKVSETRTSRYGINHLHDISLNKILMLTENKRSK